MADPYKKATINNVFGNAGKPSKMSAAGLGGSDTYAQRKDKGRVELSTWLPTDVHDQLVELMDKYSMKRPRDILVQLITDAHKKEFGG